MQQNITPLPWALDGFDIRAEQDGELLAHAYSMDDGEYDAARANAAFIVKACNAHEGLVESVKALLGCMSLAGWEDDVTAIKARAALAAAGAE